MTLQLREGWLNFPPTTGRRQRANTTVVFHGTEIVRSAQAAIKGYNVTYNNGDHHILEVEMDLDTTILENTSGTSFFEIDPDILMIRIVDLSTSLLLLTPPEWCLVKRASPLAGSAPLAGL
jgi:hypothetical protein